MPSRSARTAILVSGAALAALAGGALLGAAPNADAEEAPQALTGQLGGGIGLTDPDRAPTDQPSLNLALRERDQTRFAGFRDFAPSAPARVLELELAASHEVTGIPLDLSIAQRASFGAGDDRDVNRQSRGAELRVGRAVGDPRAGMSGPESRIYVFAASDDEALTWQPGQESRGFALQTDRVEIGDRQAGITYERGAMQASVAYVEREISATVGRTSVSDSENFAGVTLTMRR